jgi:hypothetical protein
VSTTTRTAAMTDEMDLAEGIAYMREHCERFGRAQPPEIVLGAVNQPNETWNAKALLEKIAKMRELGVTTVGATIDGDEPRRVVRQRGALR